MENYTKLRIIGTGSFGTVWLTRSIGKRRNYVLKEIPLSLVEERQRSLVLNEVKVLSQLRHMNIIRYKEAFLSNGFLCISMEYAHEGDLSVRISKQQGKTFANEQVLDWFVQLCLALKYIHGLKILHRDIKCQNIFISKENVIKLGDFGIACVLQSTLDHAQTVIGTPYYLSPEICQRQPYNHKSDIWALGCVLYEMVTLRHPFQSKDFPELVLKILHGVFTPISESHGPLLQDLVSVLLRVEPSERPSAKQILHIPAMQAHVNKVLARGKSQRAESMSGIEGQRKTKVWRKPDVMPATENRMEEITRNDQENVEEKSSLCSLDEKSWHDATGEVLQDSRDVTLHMEAVCRKRISSDVFSMRDDRVCDEKAFKKMKVVPCDDFIDVFESEKENHDPAQPFPSKVRSYSTGIVRETAERSPLAPLTRQQACLRETYDVKLEENRGSFQDTYTKSPCCSEYLNSPRKRTDTSVRKAYEKDEACHAGRSSVKQENDTSTLKTRKFLEVLFSSSSIVLLCISPDATLNEYVQAMKSKLQDRLGFEMFNTLYKYFCSDVQKDLSSGIDVCETLFEAMGKEGIAFAPLMLQFIQCERSLTHFAV